VAGGGRVPVPDEGVLIDRPRADPVNLTGLLES
jgi:hypothetical protein